MLSLALTLTTPGALTGAASGATPPGATGATATGATGATATGATGATGAPTRLPPTVASVSVSPQTTTAPLPAGFVGLGLEFQTIPAWTGAAPGQVNMALVNLIRNLSPVPVIRVGGVSTDRSWWPVPGMQRSPGVTYNLGPAWLSTAQTLVDRTGAKLILGINLEDDSTKLAQVEEQHFLAGLGREHIRAFEVGNEPELYEIYPWYKLARDNLIIPWYSTKPGRPVFSRPPGYGILGYFSDFTRFRQALPGEPLAGLDSGSEYWLSRLPGFLAAEPGLSMVTFHRYGLNGCQKNPAQPNYTSIPHLVGLHASRGLMQGVPLAVSQAHAAHAAFQIDELNSSFCDGVPGVSNSFASALWLLDTLFEMRSDGVDGVNLHTFPGAASALFDFAKVNGVWNAAVHPEYYGALMFGRAAPPGSRLLKMSATSVGAVRAWATTSTQGVRVLLINDNLNRRATVHVTVPLATRGPATVTLLTAPQPASTIKVTLGGLSFGPVTSTGRLRYVGPGGWQLPAGFPYALIPPAHHAAADAADAADAPHAAGGPPPQRTIPGRGDTFTITLPRASAALLSWSSAVR